MEDEKNNQNADTQTAPDDAQKDNEQKSGKQSEGEKTKKQGVKKGEDGSIVFKNQDELDGFINRMYAKGAKKAEQEKNPGQNQETQNNQEDNLPEKQKEVAQIDFTDKIALAMAKAGVDVQKVERAARLVDISKVLENGVVDSKKLEDEINAVIADFPELKVAKEDEKEEKGFKFGATQTNEKSDKTKKSVPTKRWNRFNSF